MHTLDTALGGFVEHVLSAAKIAAGVLAYEAHRRVGDAHPLRGGWIGGA